jgi:hypothetical protein
VQFIAVDELDVDDAEAVQGRVRRRILRAFARCGILDKDERKEMQLWNHGGGFSLDATVRIAADDRRGLERLLRYCARPPFPSGRLEELDAHRLIYHLPKPISLPTTIPDTALSLQCEHEIGNALEADPKGFRAREAVTFAVEEAPEGGDHAYHRVE